MKIKLSLFLLLISIQVFLGMATATAAISFVPGHYYGSSDNGTTINQFNAAGSYVGSLTIPLPFGSSVRGLAFGSDNLLYAALETFNVIGFSIVAMNSAGVAQQTYSGNIGIGGNSSFGKIAIDGQYLYIAGQNVLTRFLLGNPSSGTPIYIETRPGIDVFDVKPLPNGNLFMASSDRIQEITNAGSVIRTISLNDGGFNMFSGIRGIEYNAATNDLFVSEFGYSGYMHKILRLDATTGVQEKDSSLFTVDDLFLTASGELLAGASSFTAMPTFFDTNLNSLRTLGASEQQFVTQYVPEPSGVALLTVASGTLLLRRRR